MYVSEHGSKDESITTNNCFKVEFKYKRFCFSFILRASSYFCYPYVKINAKPLLSVCVLEREGRGKGLYRSEEHCYGSCFLKIPSWTSEI